MYFVYLNLMNCRSGEKIDLGAQMDSAEIDDIHRKEMSEKVVTYVYDGDVYEIIGMYAVRMEKVV